jgi:hypothetical protein
MVFHTARYYSKVFKNPTRPIAAAFATYARSLGWQHIDEGYATPSLGGVGYGYVFIFQTMDPPGQVKDALLVFLGEHGYSINSTFYIPIDMRKPAGTGGNRDLDIPIEQNGVKGSTLNDEKPYWILDGSGRDGSFYSEITDRTYPHSKEKKVPPGVSIIYFGFHAEDPNIPYVPPSEVAPVVGCAGGGCATPIK